jgi:hypothetical protein
MEHDAAVLAAGEQHHRPFRLGHAFAENLDRLGFQAVEMIAGQGVLLLRCGRGGAGSAARSSTSFDRRPGRNKCAGGELPLQRDQDQGAWTMSFTKFAVAAALAITSAATPVLAQSAAPLSVARSGAQTGNASQFWNKDDYWVPLGLFAAVIIAIVLINRSHDDDDLPHSA